MWILFVLLNTFLIHPDYTINARLLNSQRLNKQITEATQIYNICCKINALLTHKPKNCVEHREMAKKIRKDYKIAWATHPVIFMWLGYEDSLCEYIKACYIEWTTRRYKKDGSLCSYKKTPPQPKNNPIKPWWVYWSPLIISHRVILLNKEIDRKEPDWYKNIKLFLDIPPNIYNYYTKHGYIWPNRGIINK